IRHFGFLANRRRTTLLPLCFQLLGATPEPPAEEHPCSTEDAPDLYRCPKCGGRMKIIERLTAAEIQLRPPPELTAPPCKHSPHRRNYVCLGAPRTSPPPSHP